MVKLFKLGTSIASLLLLQACTTKPPEPPKEAVLNISGKNCDADISIKNTISLTPTKKNVFYQTATLVNSSSPCVKREGIDRNYLVYVLPNFEQNHTITIGGTQEVLRTFAPSISTLGNDGKAIRVFTDDRLATLGNIKGVQFRPIEGEKYILVESNPKLVGVKLDTLETRIAISNGYAYNPAVGYGSSYQTQHGFEAKQSRQYSHEGYIEVTVQAVKGKIGLPDEK